MVSLESVLSLGALHFVLFDLFKDFYISFCCAHLHAVSHMPEATWWLDRVSWSRSEGV